MLNDSRQMEDEELQSVAMRLWYLIDSERKGFGLCFGIFEFYAGVSVFWSKGE